MCHHSRLCVVVIHGLFVNLPLVNRGKQEGATGDWLDPQYGSYDLPPCSPPAPTTTRMSKLAKIDPLPGPEHQSAFRNRQSDRVSEKGRF